MNQKVSVFAPISIGNVSVGFDSLGLAVSPIDGTLVGDIVDIEAGQENQLILAGTHIDRLPSEPQDNIVWSCLSLFNEQLQKRGINVQPVHMTLRKNIPVSSGLGSSACSVVAALYALNEFYQQPFNETELLNLMAEQEGKISGSIHYDNIAPCYLGGLQLMTSDATQPCLTVPSFDDCYWVMAYPDIEVSTKMAREILPNQYDKSTCIEYGQNLAGFVAASFQNNKSLAFSLLKDVMAEPYRQSLLPNFSAVKEALIEQGCLAVGISGSGPTVFAVTDSLYKAKQTQKFLDNNYIINQQGFTHICQVDQQGARHLSN